MIADFYIKFKGKKKYNSIELSGSPKTSTKKPNILPNEVCVKMNIEIPDILFEKPVLAIKGKIDCDVSKEGMIQITNEAKSIIEKKLNITCEIKDYQ